VRRGSGQESAAADAAMAGVIARLEAEIAALDQAIKDAIGQDGELRARHDLLISVPGIATHTAAVILSELPGCCARRGKRRPMPVSIRVPSALAPAHQMWRFVLGLERLPIVDFVYFGARPDGTPRKSHRQSPPIKLLPAEDGIRKRNGSRAAPNLNGTSSPPHC
jgi:hypothetical protein